MVGSEGWNVNSSYNPLKRKKRRVAFRRSGPANAFSHLQVSLHFFAPC